MAYATLHDRLRGPVTTALKKQLGIKNTYALPAIEKVTVNVGINKSKMDSKEMHKYIEEMLMQITGQKPVFTRARIAISNFKTRENMVVGCQVTLRGKNMEEFLDRFISYVIPRIRDFRGLSAKLDGHGNYSIGLRDHSIFPEVPPPDVKQIFGLQVVITTTATTDEEGFALLKEIGIPFKREKKADAKKEAQEQKAKEEKEAAEAEAKEEIAPDEGDGESGVGSGEEDEPKKEYESDESQPPTPNS